MQSLKSFIFPYLSLYRCSILPVVRNYCSSISVPDVNENKINNAENTEKQSEFLNLTSYGTNKTENPESKLSDLYNGKKYHELPIVNLNSKKNNTVMSLTDCNGRVLAISTCGIEGFHHTKKKTTVASQTVGVSLGLKAQRLGIKEVRVKIRGIRSGGLSAVGGLALSGMDIISLTDDTRFHVGHGRRPRAPRRI